MRIRELLYSGRPSISFEFFPPKDEAALLQLEATIESLRELKPTYVSVTYGAGGSTRRSTIELVGRIRSEFGLEPLAHLTCLGSSRAEIAEILSTLAASGVENILTLRGDPPRGAERFDPHPDGFRYASELAAFARQQFPNRFCLVGAAYPEKHTEAVSFDIDLANLAKKVQAGCEVLVTQLFFDNCHYWDFVTRVRAAGIGVPIIPGIMPITNVAQVERFTRMCGAKLPPALLAEMRRLESDPAAVMMLGIAHATAQCLELLQRGAPGIHFYTLNKSPATRTILLGLQSVYPPARRPAGA